MNTHHLTHMQAHANESTNTHIYRGAYKKQHTYTHYIDIHIVMGIYGACAKQWLPSGP